MDVGPHDKRVPPRVPVSPPLKVHLASASSRRTAWLKSFFETHYEEGIVEFSAAPLLTEEEPVESGISVKAQVEQTLAAKIEAAKIEFTLASLAGRETPEFILVADTLVEDPDDSLISLGKPSDRASAGTMLLRLQGRRHLVWSGSALLQLVDAASESASDDEADSAIEPRPTWRVESMVEVATVEINQLSAAELAALLDSDSWVGKAGAYDIAGAMGEHGRVVAGDEVCVLGLAPSVIAILDEAFDGKV